MDRWIDSIFSVMGSGFHSYLEFPDGIKTDWGTSTKM
jgi:hypothetical protein